MKKVLSVLFFGGLFFGFNIFVNAKILGINDIKTKLESYNSELKEMGLEINTKLIEDNKIFEIYVIEDGQELKAITYNYGTDFIEFSTSTDDNNQNICDYNFMRIFLTGLLEKSILDLSNYPNEEIYTDYITKDMYDTYGISIEYNDDDCGSLGKFKMSINTDMIDKLMAKYGGVITFEDQLKEDVKNIIPDVELYEVSDNTITVLSRLENGNPNNYVCYLYRAESENGPFERIDDLAVNCDGVGITDVNLKSNTTYYYKSAPVNGTLQGKALKVTTNTDLTNNTTNNIETTTTTTKTKTSTEEPNPDTGVNFPTLIISSVLLISIVGTIYLKKKNYFSQI